MRTALTPPQRRKDEFTKELEEYHERVKKLQEAPTA